MNRLIESPRMRLVVLAFGAWNLVGAAAALGAGVLWSAQVSREPLPPVGFLIEGALAATVAMLSILAATLRHARGERLWWIALSLGAADQLVGLARKGGAMESVAELALVGLLAAVTVWFREPPGSAPGE